METFEHRYSTVFFMAQHGPNNGSPFFGFVNLKTTWAEWEAKLHYQVARLVALNQGAAEPIVCCDTEDMPAFFKQGIAALDSSEKLKGFVFDVEPRHYDQARQLADTMPHDDAARESVATRFTMRTQTYDDGKRITITARHLPDALHQAALLIDGFTTSQATEIVVGNTISTDDQNNQALIYGVRIEYQRSE
jgi:hypothetical protein